jgi:hypothetical protein
MSRWGGVRAALLPAAAVALFCAAAPAAGAATFNCTWNDGSANRTTAADRLAARLARDGESEPIHIQETDTTFAIGWEGRYRIDEPAFVYSDHDTGRVTTILGYPTDQLTQMG